jgi:hypothetical protein
MKAPVLVKHYHTLAPAERLSLMLAAANRGDDVEHERLVASAPRVEFRTLHSHGRAHALLELLNTHRMESLEVTALYFNAMGAAAAMDDKKIRRSATATRCFDSAMLFGYLFQARTAGWRLFCNRLALDTKVLEALMPGESVLETAAELTGQFAFTEEQALAYARRKEPDAARVPTAETIADEYQELYKARVAYWE